ncbi:MAG: hypothetical protein U0401_14735 [Anaerolineae bacterium]
MKRTTITKACFLAGICCWLWRPGTDHGAGGLLRETVRFLIPPISQAHPSTVVAKSPADFPTGELTPLADGPVFIGRDEGGLFALSAVLYPFGLHGVRSGDGLACPCHGSRFAWWMASTLVGPAV